MPDPFAEKMVTLRLRLRDVAVESVFQVEEADALDVLQMYYGFDRTSRSTVMLLPHSTGVECFDLRDVISMHYHTPNAQAANQVVDEITKPAK